MNIANKLTLLRLILIPFFVFFFYLGSTGVWIAGIIFIIASLTDFLDGYLARKLNQTTTLGAFLDPLADKVLTMSALILLGAAGTIPVWSVILILSRETLVNGLRFIAAERQIVISARMLGKIKTFTQMLSLSLLLFGGLSDLILNIGLVIYWISVVATVVSGLEYGYHSISHFKEHEQ